MPLDPKTDFFDDGGTPMYRRRREERPPQRHYAVFTSAGAAIFASFLLPIGIIVFGLLGLVVWDAFWRLFTPPI